jgi:ankyrin repeat protein
LEGGANPNVTDNFGFTPLLRDTSKGHETVAKLLLKWKANTELRDSTLGQTPLLTAIYKGHRAIVKLLLYNNANTERVNTYEVTQLLFATSGCYLAVVQLLIEKNADIGTKDIFGGLWSTVLGRRHRSEDR